MTFRNVLSLEAVAVLLAFGNFSGSEETDFGANLLDDRSLDSK